MAGFIDDLSTLHVTRCGLAHEGRADRAFCHRAARADNLACAHTTARWRLKAALDARAAAFVPGAADALARWHALDLAVGRADHDRTRAEAAGDRAAVAAAVAAHDAAAGALAALLADARGEVADAASGSASGS
ncbi:hypothetical protein ACTZWW_09095 [Salinarimonas sp. NSM]|uniref:hypothetical protein n=1 Tax=Salinarimonas sp. NSM TaxID=3458003 RepID=UPI0040363066